MPFSPFVIHSVLIFTLLCAWCSSKPYNEYIFSPSSRTIYPKGIYRTTGHVRRIGGVGNDISPNDMFFLKGPKASIIYDFGHIVAGDPTIHLSNPTCNGKTCQTFKLPSLTCNKLCQGLGLAYSEQAAFVGFMSDKSTIDSIEDGTVFLPLSKGSQTVPSKWGRGSFRYLTLSLGKNTPANTSVQLRFTNLHYTAAPYLAQNQLQSYTGHFHSSDDMLNRIWYAGAYTIQLCSVGAHTSVDHTYIAYGKGWADDANATGLSASDVFIADGAKRDRNPWAGDVSIALGSTLVTANYQNLRSIRNTIQEIIILQSKSKIRTSKTYGYFPYAGSPLGNLLILFGKSFGIPPFGSDTYHLWTIHSYMEYILVTGDIQWGERYWSKIVKGIVGTYKYIDGEGLFDGQGTLDWGRAGVGGKNTALNALYYRVLLLSANMAHKMPKDGDADPERWRTMAAKLKHSANDKLFDSDNGLYWDNTTIAGHRIHPQDGNSFALNFNLTESKRQAHRIAQGLSRRWNKYGAPVPELPGSISPFITSHELNAQFDANNGNATLPLKLIRSQWGYMMKAFSNSTFIEGYGSNGELIYGFYGNASSFISNTHAWSTGPTFSLLSYVVGIQATELSVKHADGSWAFKPWIMGSGLSHAQGGFNTTKGAFRASWRVSKEKLTANVTAPSQLKGTCYVPTLGHDQSRVTLKIDGKVVSKPDFNGPYIRVPNIKGGRHSISLDFRR